MGFLQRCDFNKTDAGHGQNSCVCPADFRTYHKDCISSLLVVTLYIFFCVFYLQGITVKIDENYNLRIARVLAGSVIDKQG